MRQDSAPQTNIDPHRIANAIPHPEPQSRYGNPESYVVNGKSYHVLASATGYRQRGIASWYGRKFHGHRTSNGDTYDMFAMTAAHKTLPLPTYVKVTNLQNDRQVIVRVNDRGPFHPNRIIDLSYAAAAKLGITATGTGMVEVEAIDPKAYQKHRQKQRPYALQTFERHPPKHAAPKMYLQLGAFSNRANARQLQQRVTHVFQSVSIDTLNQAKSPLYRVRIGPITNTDEADHLINELRQQGFSAPQIVID
jgi:rare lipoprotein A